MEQTQERGSPQQYAIPGNPNSCNSAAEKVINTYHLCLEKIVSERTRELLDANARLNNEIAERGKVIEALAESEAKYRSIFESLCDVYYRTDARGRITIISPSILSRAGYTPQELLGKPVELAYADPRDQRALFRRLLAQGGVLGHEVRLKAKDGSILDCVVDATLLRDGAGRPIGTEGVLHDVTERKRSEAALRQSEENFRRLFGESPIGAATVSLGYRIQRVNDELCRITGYSRDTLLNMNLTDILHPDEAMLDLAETRKLVAGEVDHYQADRRFIRSDGSTAWVRLSIRLMRGTRDEPLYFLPMVEDVTARKRTEAELMLYKDHLEELVDQRTEELKSANQHLQREAAERLRSEEAMRTSEERYRLLFEHSPDAVLLIRNGKIAATNPAAERVFGHEPGWFTGRSINDISPEFQPDGRSSAEVGPWPMVGSAEISPRVFEWVFRHRGGALLDCEASVVEYRENDEVTLQAIVRDVTERRRVEEHKRKLEKELETQKWHFYRDTICSVTNGKLDIVDQTQVALYISTAQIKFGSAPQPRREKPDVRSNSSAPAGVWLTSGLNCLPWAMARR